ncbi:permease-like cell division protein FtsX [Phytohabitans flavus]|uniref:permease-like cell division protein FtsX n=1 Tax=Phytohabitans flavus TaxID=1076124 RepID=UPI0036383BD9
MRQVWYQSKDAAYARFKEMYRDAPDLVAAVQLDQIPEEFRVRLAQPEGRLALQEELQARPGVSTVVGARCALPGETE